MLWCRYCGRFAADAMCCADSECRKQDLNAILNMDLKEVSLIQDMTFTTGSGFTVNLSGSTTSWTTS